MSLGLGCHSQLGTKFILCPANGAELEETGPRAGHDLISCAVASFCFDLFKCSYFCRLCGNQRDRGGILPQFTKLVTKGLNILNMNIGEAPVRMLGDTKTLNGYLED